jgi:phosphoinositide-3-kinase, regulatory subunit 4
MGQGFSIGAPSAGTANIDVPELADLVYEKSVGAARFMKAIRARHHDGVVLVKAVVRPRDVSFDKYKEAVISQ